MAGPKINSFVFLGLEGVLIESHVKIPTEKDRNVIWEALCNHPILLVKVS